MIKGEGTAYHQAGHVVMAYFRDVNFDEVTIMGPKRVADCILEYAYDAAVPGELNGTEAQS